MLLVWHTVGGILALIAGVLAARYVGRAGPRYPRPFFRAARIAAWAAGFGLAALSFTFAGDIGYSIPTPEGLGKVVGIPFFVAFFDAEGSDYLGWITYVGIFGNVVVWLLFPQLVLAMYLRFHVNTLTPNNSLERSREP